MSAVSSPLTLTRARVLRAEEVLTLDDWQRESDAEYDTGDVSPDRSAAEFLYSRIGRDVRSVLRSATAGGRAQFRFSRTRTQEELAERALAALAECFEPEELAARCAFMVGTTTSVDESVVFHSLVGRVASSRGLSRIPHFAVSQLQGASFTLVADIVDSMLVEPESGALVVAVERWPLGYPRAWGEGTVAGDGAVAAWLTRSAERGLRYLGGALRAFDPFIAEAPIDLASQVAVEVRGLKSTACAGQSRAENRARDDRAMTLDVSSMVDAAASVITQCLQAHDIAPAALTGWVSSGLAPEIDHVVRSRLGVRAPIVAEPRADDGYWCAAAAPALLAEVAENVASGRIEEGALLLSWSLSFGGSVGAQIWQAAGGEEA